jgi:tRNA dimethylallyltransferase
LNTFKMPLTGEDKPLLVILGATAVGKTGLSIPIAEALGGEIVSADSRQIYREMDIGTAKPTPEQRAQAVHHLIDAVSPDEEFALGDYQSAAYATIHRLHLQDKLPILVGGTGQYITAVLEGWSIPRVPPNPTLRAELEAFAQEKGVEALYARLLELDPDAQQFVEPRNTRRIVRALEVCIETGKPFSWQRKKNPPPYRTLVYGLTLEREKLYARADQRVVEMMATGFLDEVRGLLAKGYSRALPSMSGIGYAQLAAHLLDGVPLNEAVQATQHATHDFIRRQTTWFKGHDHGIVWHNVDQITAGALIEAARAWLEG